MSKKSLNGFCTECGAAVSSTDKFCAGCGHNLGGGVPSRRLGWVTSDADSNLRMSLWGRDIHARVQV